VRNHSRLDAVEDVSVGLVLPNASVPAFLLSGDAGAGRASTVLRSFEAKWGYDLFELQAGPPCDSSADSATVSKSM